MALGGIASAALLMILNAPPPAKQEVKRQEPSRPLAYQQAISGERAAETDKDPAKADEKAPTAETEKAAPDKTPNAESAEKAPAPAPEPKAETPPRVAAVPQDDGNAAPPPMPSVPQSHETWAPPDEESSSEGYDQGADQWRNPDEGQWGNESYDEGYDQGLGGYDQPNDQWGDQGYDQGGYDQGNNQWANAPPNRGSNPPPDQWGNAPPPQDQWGNAPPPQDQWGNAPNQQPGQWADQNTEIGEQWVQVVQSGAEMRASAADSAPLLFAFPSGRNLRVVSRHEDWVQVTDPQSSATGWMRLHHLAPSGAPRPPGYEPQYDAYYQEPPRERRGLFRGGFADMINRAFGGGQ